MFIAGTYILILFRTIVHIVIVVLCCLHDDCYVLFSVPIVTFCFQCLESKKTSHGRNTLTLFEEYIKSRDSSVNAVMKALESMERKDALEVLQNSIPGKE